MTATQIKIAKFWARVDKDGPLPAHRPELGQCWVWMGYTTDDGYGRIGFGGLANRGTHRLSWALEYGAVPDGQWVLHRCDNPACVRPEHLFLGDATDNNRARQAKGRTRGWAGRTGRAHHAFRATPAVVAEARRLRSEGLTQIAIASRVGISRGHISKILLGAR